MKPTKYKGGICSPPAQHRGNSKNTRLWCKGKVGCEHQKAWKPGIGHFSDWFTLTCEICGKKFDYCYRLFSGWRKGWECKCGNHVLVAHKEG